MQPSHGAMAKPKKNPILDAERRAWSSVAFGLKLLEEALTNADALVRNLRQVATAYRRAVRRPPSIRVGRRGGRKGPSERE